MPRLRLFAPMRRGWVSDLVPLGAGCPVQSGGWPRVHSVSQSQDLRPVKVRLGCCWTAFATSLQPSGADYEVIWIRPLIPRQGRRNRHSVEPTHAAHRCCRRRRRNSPRHCHGERDVETGAERSGGGNTHRRRPGGDRAGPVATGHAGSPLADQPAGHHGSGSECAGHAGERQDATGAGSW